LVTSNGKTTIECRRQCEEQTVVKHQKGNPIKLLSAELRPYKRKVESALNAASKSDDHKRLTKLFSPLLGGAFGYLSYELGRYLEELPQQAKNDIEMPDMAMGIYEVVLITSHEQKASWIVDVTGENADLINKWLDVYNQYIESIDQDLKQPWQATSELESNYSRLDYEKKFDAIKAYLKEGDAYQINLTKRFNINVEGDPFASYCRMRKISPAPYGAYMNFPFAQVLSNSPEQFIEVDSKAVLTSPIKGTNPRDKEVLERDLVLAQSLADSKKDRAENLMIVDLMRNDLGRVCEVGSVIVPKLFGIESYANVHHMVSHIRGRLLADKNAIDLLIACFPGGSITGAPKKRAMEIIDELEPTARGVYCGAIGWIGFGGNMQTNIAIRTITHIDGVAYFSAGGGIVMDSEVESEYQELKDKANVMAQIVGVLKE